jgi:cob(I)alamin adenosyltransferase
MSFKIYTKTGDKGKTSLIGGTRVSKNHYRIEAYGTVDELNSFIGLVRDVSIEAATKLILEEIQDRLFTLGSQFAQDPKKKTKMVLPEISENDITILENEIDRLNATLTPLKNFILPGGHPSVSFCHIARCVCRRAERNAIALNRYDELNPLGIIYLNRLSDYLFTLARNFSKELNVEETTWKPRV